MQEQQFNLIVKNLSNEATEEEKLLFEREMQNNLKFRTDFNDIQTLWNSLNYAAKSFEKERILKLINLKISQNKKQKHNRLLYTSLKYAAVFIGLLVISVTIYRDLNNVETIANNTGKVEKIVLPDQTTVTLNQNAKIEYENSTIKGFNRKVKLTGEAFFEVSKKQNQKFIVKTDHYDITVLGTKFNVRTYQNSNSVVLTEGKVLLNNFKIQNKQIVMKPGEIVKFNPADNRFIQEKINPVIYTSWINKRLEFDNLSLNDLAKLLKVRYHKTLIIENEDAENKHISGSAPADDVHLIVKALQSILKTGITEKNDTIIIN